MSAQQCPSCHTDPRSDSRCASCGALIATRCYRVDGLLSIGPRGRVYRAQSQHGPVALKELVFAGNPTPKQLERFEREAALLRELNNPSVPRFVDAFVEGEKHHTRMYLAQAFVAGDNLEALLGRQRFDELHARAIATEVLEALVYLHGRNPPLIHRDVKPANIIRTAGEKHVLVDFGGPREPGQAPPTSAGFGYLPPDAKEPDERSDLWALGMTLVRVLSRREVGDLFDPDFAVTFRPFVNASEPFMEFLDGLLAPSARARFKTAALALQKLRKLPRTGGEDDIENDPLLQTDATAVRSGESRPGVLEALRLGGRRKDLDITWLRARQFVDPAGSVPWAITVSGYNFGLHPGCLYLVGRTEESDIHVDDSWPQADTVSRRHALLKVTPEGLKVRDLDSTNGTYAGAMRVFSGGPEFTLREQDVVQFGKLTAVARPLRGPPHVWAKLF